MSRFYVTTPIYYVNGAPHIGHAYTSDCRRRAGALETARRLRRVLPHRHRRARAEGREGRRRTRRACRRKQFADGVAKPISRRHRPTAWACQLRRLHPHHGGRGTSDGCAGVVAARWPRAGRALPRQPTTAGMRFAMKHSTTRASWSPAPRRERAWRRRGRRSRGCASRAGSSGCRPGSDRLLAHYEAAPRLHPVRNRAAARSLSFVRGGLRDLSVSRTRPSRGACRCRAIRRHVMYVWLDALDQLHHRDGLSGPDEDAPRWPVLAGATCTWWARRSSASTPSIGRRS